jgi:predicted cupin superfamily sugar epimerase
MHFPLLAIVLTLGAHQTLAKPRKTIHTAHDIITALNLTPNVEKGYYTETYASSITLPTNNSTNTARSLSTAIYYLLEGRDDFSHWHRVDAPEIWHHYAGASMIMELSWDNGTGIEQRRLGKDILAGERPQIVVDEWQWQRAKSLGDWTLVGTTMAPGFSEEGFEMPGEGWVPDGGMG